MSAPSTPGQGVGCPLVLGAVAMALGAVYLAAHAVVWMVTP